MQNRHGLTLDSTVAYAIRVQGYLDTSWSDRLGGIAIQPQTPPNKAPVTILTGKFADQAALAGVLNTLYDLGLPLLSVECVGIEGESPST